MSYRYVADEVLAGNHTAFEISEIINMLQAADDMYHNDQESFVTDEEYDAIRLLASRLDPSHVYFTGVGSEVRGGKVKLPFEMGSLDQVEIGAIEDWVRRNGLQDEKIVATDKMDGTSALIIYGENGQPQIAYSRGNGTEGADISRHIFKIKNVPTQVSGRMVIRAEVEMTETGFGELKTKITRHSSKDSYKNARNAVAGLMNRKENPDIVYDYLNVIAYEVVGADMSKLDMLEMIEKEGFQCVDYKTFSGSALTDEMLADYLNERRTILDYAIDGVVLDVERKEKRDEMNPTRDTLNPAYSIKYKVADESNLAVATVKGVTWNISKHGYLKPQVNIEPVELVGVTVSNATGFNAKFINDNGIGPGAKIKITRSGDVIPFILEVVEPATADMPMDINNCYWTVNDKGENVDLVLNDHHDNDEVKIQQAIDFFTSIDAPHLREGSVRKLATFVGDDIIGDIIRMDKNKLVGIIGENGNKIYDGLRAKLTNIPLFVLMGSVPFFGRGVGKRKFKKLINAIGWEIVYTLCDNDSNIEAISDVDGFDTKTANKIIHGVEDYLTWLGPLEDDYITIQYEEAGPTGTSMEGQKVVFTGFRDKDLQAAVEAAGGEMQSGVSGKTTMLVTKDPNSTSGKVQKARDKGVKIVGIDELKGML